MHSLAMAQDILKAALSEAKTHEAKHIKAISVKMGDRHFIESDSLQFCLEAAAKGTIAEGAHIDVELLGTTVRCRKCAFVFPVADDLPIWPHCGDRNPEILGSDEPPQVTLELD